jgi:hypothetical protein
MFANCGSWVNAKESPMELKKLYASTMFTLISLAIVSGSIAIAI